MAPVLRRIDGSTARDAEANEVLATFAKETLELSKEVERMSAFLVVAFDDEGFITSRLYYGHNFPIPPPMLPDIIRDAVVSDVYKST